jgi:hypothetical protein
VEAPKKQDALEEVINDLLSKPAQSTKRLTPLADHLKFLIEQAGLPGAEGGSSGELTVPGLARRKDWDVAYAFAGKFRLLISMKSMLKNISGSVPNRLDDLQGEIANVQQLMPEVVVGYVIMFDVAEDSKRNEDQRMWSDFFKDAIGNITIRKAPLWNQGLLEGSWFIRIDSRKPKGQRLVDPAQVAKDRETFISSLLGELRRREPAIPFTKDLPPEPLVTLPKNPV